MKQLADQKERSIDAYILSELGIERKEYKKRKGAFILRFQDLQRWGLDFNREGAVDVRNIVSKYPTKKLFEITKDTSGGKWGDETESKDSILVKVIRATNFDNIDNLNLKNITERAIKKSDLNEFLLKKGDILVEKSGGGEKTPVGRVAYMNSDSEYGYSNFLQKITISNNVMSQYVYHVLGAYHSVGFTQYLQMNTTGLRNLIMEDYWEVNIPIPPPSKQKEISTTVEAMKQEIRQTREREKRILEEGRNKIRELSL